MIRYTVSYNNPLSHLINIVMTFEANTAQNVEVRLPTWRPGRYELGDFAKNILRVSAKGSTDGLLPMRKLNKSSWSLFVNGKQSIEISYQYYAYKMDAGNSWLHDDQLYVNPVNCLVYLPDRMEEPVELLLELPDNYEVATGLTKEGRRLLAKDFYELADGPFIASPTLTHLTYEVDRITFHIWHRGLTDVKPAQMLKDFRKFTTTQLRLFGDLPVTDYHFLLQFLSYPAYHGVEHANSTVITLGPCTGEHTASFYEKLLGISSHELFHAWNITRIRPTELQPYDFSKENYFETGYVAEGFTTYYGDLMLVRSGVYDEEWYLNELNKLLSRHFQNFGRFNQSVAESSFDLWLDGYQAGVPNRKVSIYVKGAIIALMLDFTIRIASGGKYSMDDVMRALWVDLYKSGKPYEKNDIQNIAEKFTACPLQDFFDKFVDGNEPIENELGTLADQFGLALQKKLPEAFHERELGFKVRVDGDRWVVSHVHPKSPACEMLSVDDEIVNVNSETDVYKMLAAFTTDSTIKVNRYGRTIDLYIATGRSFYESYSLEKKKDPTVVESSFFKNWLVG
ncbi:MAG: M61 family peptidase [Imperialibacter sp.]